MEILNIIIERGIHPSQYLNQKVNHLFRQHCKILKNLIVNPENFRWREPGEKKHSFARAFSRYILNSGTA